MARRSAKPRVVWLPPTNVNSVDASNRSCWNIISSASLPVGAGNTVSIEAPLVQDGSQSSPLDPTASLADIENSGYRLRRIVGKLYVFVAQTDPISASTIGVTAALIVRRTDETGQSLAVQTSSGEDISPADITNSMDPWIWRRSWLLQNGPTHVGETGALSIEVLAEQHGRGPGQNFGFYTGGNVEGPTVDQKTARIVGPEERLFLDVSATDVLGSGSEPTTLVCIYEFRVLASMRSSMGNRRNASR